jgi:hypothetical protein
MNWTMRSFLFVLLPIGLLAQPVGNVTGLWDGTIQYGGYHIPFEFELTQNGQSLTASFLNGDDRVTATDGHWDGNTLSLNFAQYSTHLQAILSQGVIRGTYGNSTKGLHAFEAKRHQQAQSSHEQAPDIAGIWDLPNESPKGEHAWQMIVRQQGKAVSAAILRVDGDTGEMTGQYAKGKFVLSHFDGARASLLEITPRPNGTLDVALHGANSVNSLRVPSSTKPN